MDSRKHHINNQLKFWRHLVVVLLVPPAMLTYSQAPVPNSSHIVLIMDENTSFSTAVASMPWLRAQGAANGHALNYSSNTSGSLMDYLWVFSGSCESGNNCALPAGTHDFGFAAS